MPRHNRPKICDESLFTAAAVDYAHNILVTTSLRRLEPLALGRIDGIDLVLDMARAGRERSGSSGARGELGSNGLRSSLRRYLAKSGGQPRPPRLAASPAAENLTLIGNLIDLTENERAVFQFLLTLQDNPSIRALTGAFGGLTVSGIASIIAAATALTRDAVLQVLGQESRLISSGLVVVGNGELDLPDKIDLKCGILEAATAPTLDEKELLTRFLSESAPATLGWDDFVHLREEAIFSRNLLAGALKNRHRGINILFYGESGTGKTELARLLARDIVARLYLAGRADEKGESALPRERLSSLLLGQRLIGNSRAILLFDEMEDLFRTDSQFHFGGRQRRHASMSKQWFNDLLETNQIPTIWITNTTEGIDPAFLRRFLYAMEFRPLGPRQRARALARHVGHESDLNSSDIAAIADRYLLSPGLFGSAVAAARLVSPEGRPNRASIESVLAPMGKLVTGIDSSRRPIFEASSYRLDGLNSPADLEGIADRLSRWKPDSREGISLCLYGPPGTGKSEYVKYLAHRMGRPVLHRRVSDITSCWLGESEKNIASAFREAEENDSVLLFDEADSFLRDRGKAMRSWEVTEVNEFLQQLESFRGVVACTTNLWRDLDEASLRRFVFKIEFRYLQAAQSVTIFRSMFARDLLWPLTEQAERSIRSALSRLDNLTPGDFAAVARQVRTLNRKPVVAELLALLEAEVKAKPGTARAVGF